MFSGGIEAEHWVKMGLKIFFFVGKTFLTLAILIPFLSVCY